MDRLREGGNLQESFPPGWFVAGSVPGFQVCSVPRDGTVHIKGSAEIFKVCLLVSGG